MTLRVGQSALVRFPEDDQPLLWQERVLVAAVGRSTWIAASADQDLDAIDLDEFETKLLRPGRKLPTGVRERDCYLVFDDGPGHFFMPDVMADLIAQGQVMADASRLELGFAELPVAAGAGASSAALGPPAAARAKPIRRVVGKTAQRMRTKKKPGKDDPKE